MNILNIEFQYPICLLLLLLIPIIAFFELKKNRKWINFWPIELLNRVYWTNSLWWYTEIVIKIGIFVCFVLLLASPWFSNIKKEENKKWIDIAIVLDISKSMLAEDISPNRIESAKKVIADFIGKIESDRISFTIFAGKPFVSIPLTFDYSNIIKYVKSLTTDSIAQQIDWLSWTAIWDWLMLWADSLTSNEKDKTREKVIILLTDWEANMWINPKIALKYVKDKNIKIYTIGIWKPGWTELYITDSNGNKEYFRDATWTPIKAKVDEELLTNLATTTWWEYYNAQSSNSLKVIFEDLWKLNKTEIETKTIKLFNSSYNNLLIILITLLICNLILTNKYKYR